MKNTSKISNSTVSKMGNFRNASVTFPRHSSFMIQRTGLKTCVSRGRVGLKIGSLTWVGTGRWAKPWRKVSPLSLSTL